MDKGRMGVLSKNRIESQESSICEDSFDQFFNNATKDDESFENVVKSSLLKLKLSSPEINHVLKENYISDETHKILKGQYGEIIKQKVSCRIFQQLLMKTNKRIISDIYNELKDNLSFYLTDVYSNYFLQKLYCYLDIPIYSWQFEGSRAEYLEIVLRDFVKIACNSVGTFVVQKLIDSFESQTERDIVFSHISTMPANTILMIATVSKHLIYNLKFFRISMEFLFWRKL